MQIYFRDDTMTNANVDAVVEGTNGSRSCALVQARQQHGDGPGQCPDREPLRQPRAMTCCQARRSLWWRHRRSKAGLRRSGWWSRRRGSRHRCREGCIPRGDSRPGRLRQIPRTRTSRGRSRLKNQNDRSNARCPEGAPGSRGRGSWAPRQWAPLQGLRQ